MNGSRKTRRPRLVRAFKAIRRWCRDHRHWSVPEQHGCLCAKLRGHYAFYGIRGNYKALEVVYEYAETAWKHWFGRRTRNGYLTWEVSATKYLPVFPLARRNNRLHSMAPIPSCARPRFQK